MNDAQDNDLQTTVLTREELMVVLSALTQHLMDLADVRAHAPEIWSPTLEKNALALKNALAKLCRSAGCLIHPDAAGLSFGAAGRAN